MGTELEEKMRELLTQYEAAQVRDRLESEARLNARAAVIADLKRLLTPPPAPGGNA